MPAGTIQTAIGPGSEWMTGYDDTNSGLLITRNSQTGTAHIGSVPVVSGLSCVVYQAGAQVTLDFTFAGAVITVTDGAASGAHGALKIFDFAQQAISFMGCRQDYTAFAEGAALTGAAGDAAFVIGIGTTAIAAAADAVLAAANQNVGASIAVTLSAGTGVGTGVLGAVVAAINGTATATDLYLNWSGSAATIDANSTIAVTGTARVVCLMLGDD